MKRRWWRILTLMQAVLLTGMPVQAAAADRMLQVQIYAGDYCYVESSGASTIRAAQMAGLCEIDSVYKDVGNLAYLNLGVGTFRNGLYGLVLSKRDYASLLAVHERCQAWLRGHMEEIVPEGTPWRAAITLCADWIADHTAYDSEALRDPKRMKHYQSAESCFYAGTGICATYATAFDSMVNFLPLDPTTGCVSWRAEDPIHLNTRYVGNDRHLWSAVWEKDGWHFYDITFYDNGGRERRPEYLDMKEAAMQDGLHDAIDTYFAPEERTFVMR